MNALKIVGICLAQLIGGPCLGPVGLVSWGVLVGFNSTSALHGRVDPWALWLLTLQTAGFLFGVVLWLYKRRPVSPAGTPDPSQGSGPGAGGTRGL